MGTLGGILSLLMLLAREILRPISKLSMRTKLINILFNFEDKLKET